MTESLPRVVIIGGGFGGLTAARALRRAPVRVTLVDRRNHHLFQPLLYQVATAGLNPSDIASPIRRVLVNSDLTVPGFDEAYVIGDAASLIQDGAPIPGVAPAAVQEGRHAAKNIGKSIRGELRVPFRYRDKGSMATIGRWSAVAQYGRFRLSGPLAWLAWLFVHVMFLIEFRNRLIVLVQWAWSFVSYDRGARLITGPLRSEPKQAPVERK